MRKGAKNVKPKQNHKRKLTYSNAVFSHVKGLQVRIRIRRRSGNGEQQKKKRMKKPQSRRAVANGGARRRISDLCISL